MGFHLSAPSQCSCGNQIMKKNLSFEENPNKRDRLVKTQDGLVLNLKEDTPKIANLIGSLHQSKFGIRSRFCNLELHGITPICSTIGGEFHNIMHINSIHLS
jgi:hypothetical protein